MSYRSDKERIEEEIRLIKKVYFWGFLIGGIGIVQVILIALLCPLDVMKKIFKIEMTIAAFVMLACTLYIIALIVIGLHRKSKR